MDSNNILVRENMVYIPIWANLPRSADDGKQKIDESISCRDGLNSKYFGILIPVQFVFYFFINYGVIIAVVFMPISCS